MRILAAALVLSSALWAAAPDEFKTSAGTLEITPIQHASLMLKAGGKVMYVDPAQGSYEGLPQADYILITDIHGDHFVPAILDKLKKAGTVIVAPKVVAEKYAGARSCRMGKVRRSARSRLRRSRCTTLKPAANGTTYHEKGRGNGYILTYGGKRIYFAGDTEGTPEMRALKNIDVAFIPMNLPFTMTPQDAAEAVKAFHPAVVYPYHYRGQDPSAFRQSAGRHGHRRAAARLVRQVGLGCNAGGRRDWRDASGSNRLPYRADADGVAGPESRALTASLMHLWGSSRGYGGSRRFRAGD